MNDMDVSVSEVLAGIDAAHAAGFGSIKVNMVVQRGVNDHGIVDFAKHFKGSGHIARFIEFMDVGSTNGWRMDDVVPSAEVVRRIDQWSPLEVLSANYEGEVAERWRYVDGGGEIGVISSVTQAFCSSCTRARLSTDGKLYTCLFADKGVDFRAVLRSGASDEEVLSRLVGVWARRDDRYSETRTAETASLHKVEMSYIGG
jgi:cyclic pyranopterin phosphate synthase